jgi:hypothetical protein
MRVEDETEDDLLTLISADFGPFPLSDLHNVFIDWLHYKARRIPVLSRKVVTSAEVSALSQHYSAISRIKFALQAGLNVDPWLGLRTANTRI